MIERLFGDWSRTEYYYLDDENFNLVDPVFIDPEIYPFEKHTYNERKRASQEVIDFVSDESIRYVEADFDPETNPDFDKRLVEVYDEAAYTKLLVSLYNSNNNDRLAQFFNSVTNTSKVLSDMPSTFGAWTYSIKAENTDLPYIIESKHGEITSTIKETAAWNDRVIPYLKNLGLIETKKKGFFKKLFS